MSSDMEGRGYYALKLQCNRAPCKRAQVKVWAVGHGDAYYDVDIIE